MSAIRKRGNKDERKHRINHTRTAVMVRMVTEGLCNAVSYPTGDCPELGFKEVYAVVHPGDVPGDPEELGSDHRAGSEHKAAHRG